MPYISEKQPRSSLRPVAMYPFVLSGILLFSALPSLSQSGSQIVVGPGVISTLASQTNSTLSSAGFNGIAYRPSTQTLYVSDAHAVSVTANVANIYAVSVQTGQVTRIAGPAPSGTTGNTGYSGDGGPAINATLNKPAGLALDSSFNNLYIADQGQNVVRKIDLNSGTISTVAGNGDPQLGVFAGDGGPATSARLSGPVGIAVNSSGDLYIADTFNNRVRMVAASTGIITTVAGNGVQADGGDGGPATSASLNIPVGVAVDSANNLYISDTRNHRVRQVSGGTITTIAGQGAGSPGFSPDGTAGASAVINSPYGIAVDAGGTVYFADAGNNRIRTLSASGARTLGTVAGNGTRGYSGDGGSALSAALFSPAALTIDPTSNFYFIDANFTVVRKVSSATAPAMFPLTAVGSSASLNLVVSNTGNQTLIISQLNFPTNFTLTGGTCGAAPISLSPGTSCTLTVTFTPTNGGPTAGTLNIVSNANGGSTTQVYLSESNGLYFVPVRDSNGNPTTCRVVDTRLNIPTYGVPFLAANTSRTFVIRNSRDAGCGSLPIPSNADVQAYSLNVTVVPRGSLSFLTVWPANSTRPTVSLLNSNDGRTKANAIIVPANTGDTDRAISVYGTGDTEVIIDINGYYVPEANAGSFAYYPLPPCRIVDTRESNRNSNLGTPYMHGGETRDFPLRAGGCNLPSSAQAYALNYTAIPRTSSLGYITTWPTGSPQPVVSTLNATTGAVTANAAIVPAGSNGSVSVFARDDTDLIIDVSGYYAIPGTGGLALYNLTPCRAYDTRTIGSGSPINNGVTNVNISANGCSVPAAAQSFVLNATVVPSGSLSYLTLWAQGATQPVQSTLNAYDGAVTSNLAVVPTLNGSVSSFTTAQTQLILDLFGYFAP